MAQNKEIGNFTRVDRIFLDHENPRHEPYENQADVIAYLCKDEYVLRLAKDIAHHGLNPLELLAIIPVKGKNTFTSAEGNRRMCALKLLNDPDLAPPNQRKEFEKLAKIWVPIAEVPTVEFKDRSEVNLWLERIHNGLAGGIGRKTWTSDQKTRHTGDRKNKPAQVFLDYAEANGMISSADRRGKLTTVQRFLSNILLRDTLGIDQSNPDEIAYNRPKEDFDLLANKFIGDLLKKDGKVNSRQNKQQIDAYARELGQTEGLTGKTVEPEPLNGGTEGDGKPKPSSRKPKNPGEPKKLPYDENIAQKLNDLGSHKLKSLYYSICDISLNAHTPLAAIGFWAFMESLSAKIGRNTTTDFHSFLNVTKLEGYGLGNRRKTTSLRQAIDRISKYGNTTKHDEAAAHFNGPQLANDMETMQKMIFKCVEEAITKK